MSAKVLVEPVAAHRRRADHTDRLVGLLLYLIALLAFPGLHAQMIGPGVTIALAFDTNEDRAGRMLMCLGVLTGLVLGDLHVEIRPGHMRLDAPVVEGAPIVRRQLA